MDEQIYDEQMAQLDPELREQLATWLEERARAQALPASEEELAAADDLADETDAWRSHGRAVGTHDPAGDARRESERAEPWYDMEDLLTARDPDRVVERRHPGRVLDLELAAKLEMLHDRDGGSWGSVVDTARGSSWGDAYGASEAGMTAHRGVLRGDEHVDDAAVLAAIEAKLGATVDELREVYGSRNGGPLPQRLRPVRDRVDRALAGVEDVSLLASALGVPGLAPALRRGRTRGLRQR